METVKEMPLSESNVTRRSLMRIVGLGAVAASASAVLAGCGGGSSGSGTSSSDQAILSATAIAEAVAATLYANIIMTPSIYSTLAGKPFDQAYLVAAYQQEVAHYQLLTTTNGGNTLATNQNFFYPTGTFQSVQTTFNTLQIVEDLLIATYLFGVNNYSSGTFRVQAAQTLGVESEHRALGRMTANDLGLPSTSNLSGGTENLGGGNAANNYQFERSYPNLITSLSSITNILNNFQNIGAGGFGQTAYPINVVGTLSGINPINQDNTSISN